MSMYLTNNSKSTNTSLCMINKSTNTQNINLPVSSYEMPSVPAISFDLTPSVTSQATPLVASGNISVNEGTVKDVTELEVLKSAWRSPSTWLGA